MRLAPPLTTVTLGQAIGASNRCGVRIIIEFDGPIIDIRRVYYQAHRDIATEVGWSRLDEPTFWRLTRTKGQDAQLLPGAGPIKLKHYFARFRERLEDDDLVSQYSPHNGVETVLAGLAREGSCSLVTLGANLDARRRVLDHVNLSVFFTQIRKLDPDPRRRPAELKILTADYARTVVVASTDALIRAAGAAELFTVGITSGPCAAPRLYQAGADVVYARIDQLAASLASGAPDLIRAGLLPPPVS